MKLKRKLRSHLFSCQLIFFKFL